MNSSAQPRIYVAGHNGMVGASICRRLEHEGYSQLIVREKDELNLLDRQAVDRFFASEKPEWVFLAAARVGGILANRDYPADFIYQNLTIQNHVIDAAYRNGCQKLLFLGSSCIYPREAAQPMTEGMLLTGPLEETNQWYAIAKIAGIKLCQAYRQQYGFDAISLMPTNLYGPGDNFDLNRSHVLPALLRKFHDAAEAGLDQVTLWGTGTPRREFLHVDDLAAACVFSMQSYSAGDLLNVGVGKDLTIAELADLIAGITGFAGQIHYDTSRPDGAPQKLLDVSRIHALGWQAQIGLHEGIEQTLSWYLNTATERRGVS